MGNVAGINHSNLNAAAGSNGLLVSRVSLLARKYCVSQSDIFVLYERFQQLNPNSDGFIDRNMFDVEKYADPFCRQVWGRLSGDKSDANKVDFESFVKTAVWWQEVAVNMKLKLLFSWMADEVGISAETLAKVLRHVLWTYTQDELIRMSVQIVGTMSSVSKSDAVDVVNEEDFLSWFSDVSPDRLMKSLDFRICFVKKTTYSADGFIRSTFKT